MTKYIKVKTLRRDLPDPPLDERKIFWGWMYAYQCFRDVESACTALADPVFKPVAKHLICAVVVTYGKPFTAWAGLEKLTAAGKEIRQKVLNESVIPAEFLPTHRKLLDFRHRVFAHVDAKDFQADDPAFGNINQVRFSIDNGDYTVSVLNPSDKLLEVSNVQALAKLLRDKATYHTDRFIDKYKPAARLRNGHYALNLDPAKADPFLPIPPKYIAL